MRASFHKPLPLPSPAPRIEGRKARGGVVPSPPPLPFYVPPFIQRLPSPRPPHSSRGRAAKRDGPVPSTQGSLRLRRLLEWKFSAPFSATRLLSRARAHPPRPIRRPYVLDPTSPPRKRLMIYSARETVPFRQNCQCCATWLASPKERPRPKLHPEAYRNAHACIPNHAPRMTSRITDPQPLPSSAPLCTSGSPGRLKDICPGGWVFAQCVRYTQ